MESTETADFEDSAPDSRRLRAEIDSEMHHSRMLLRRTWELTDALAALWRCVGK